MVYVVRGEQIIVNAICLYTPPTRLLAGTTGKLMGEFKLTDGDVKGIETLENMNHQGLFSGWDILFDKT